MKEIKELKNDLFLKTMEDKKKAWSINDFDKAIEIRKREQTDFEKWKLLSGIIKANEKGKINNETRNKRTTKEKGK